VLFLAFVLRFVAFFLIGMIYFFFFVKKYIAAMAAIPPPINNGLGLKLVPVLAAVLVVLLGLFAGGQAYIHSLGVFIAVFISISFFVFYPSQIKEKVKFSLLLFLTILLSGGIHYIMDVFFGTGWIFQEIKYY
jgi:hypothetical protein